MRASTYALAFVLASLCGGCGSPKPMNLFPGGHALRVINASGFDCDVTAGKKETHQTVDSGRGLEQIPVGGAGVLHLAPATYGVTAWCGPSRFPGSLDVTLGPEGATDVIVLSNPPANRRSAWIPEHGGAALQVGLYRPAAESGPPLPSACETRCGDQHGVCFARSKNTAPCAAARERCLDACHSQ